MYEILLHKNNDEKRMIKEASWRVDVEEYPKKTQLQFVV